VRSAGSLFFVAGSVDAGRKPCDQVVQRVGTFEQAPLERRNTQLALDWGYRRRQLSERPVDRVRHSNGADSLVYDRRVAQPVGRNCAQIVAQGLIADGGPEPVRAAQRARGNRAFARIASGLFENRQQRLALLDSAFRPDCRGSPLECQH
jgi:hypothetical protein